MKKLMLGLMMAFAVTAARAVTSETDFEFSNGVIMKYKGSGGDVEIPSKIDGQAVTSIGDYAFSMCHLSAVVVPEGVVCINKGAFYYCSELKSIQLSSTVTNIGYSSFEHCVSLTAIEFPQALISIEGRAFCGCSGLVNLKIPLCVITVGAGAFSSCCGLRSAVLPSSVEVVGDEAFLGCYSLTDLDICTGARVGNEAFRGCNGLADKDGFVIVNGCLHDYIGQSMFVEIPSVVTNIGDSAFCECDELVSVTLPDGIVRIGSDAFCLCKKLQSLTIPSSVTQIGAYAFAGCANLKQIKFEGDAPQCRNVFADDYVDVPFTPAVIHVKQGSMGWVNWQGRSLSYDVDVSPVTTNIVEHHCYMTITNVVVNYILNSVEPAFANPPTADTGFVNIITEVKGGAVAVPASWADNYPSFTTKFGTDFTKALSMKTGKNHGAGNDMFVWQDYVAGTDPTKPEDKFTASITVVEGKVTVSYTPELDDDRKALRKYTTWGKKSLLDANWTVVQEGQEAEYNFFKVSVEMK